mmetsp:Transcript_76547/g.212598  ORF Transcript_76547/g.212598 Transcript_76547/m.212598 type:complete len:313 (+) Transcript_76547:78-1016(+)
MGQRPCYVKQGEGAPKDAPECAVKSFAIQGSIRSTGRIGEVVSVDPHDAQLTYKIKFSDGESPELDWFSGSSVRLCSLPFTVSVRTIFRSCDFSSVYGEVFDLSGLHAEDSLATLYSKVEERLGLPHGPIHLSLEGEAIHIEEDLDYSLGLLGVGPGSQIDCIVNEFSPALLRIESASEPDYEDGESVLRTVTAVIHGQRSSDDELLLWAAESVERVHKNCARSQAHLVFLSADGAELSTPGVRRLPISTLVMKARDQPPACLEDQFKAYFGEACWPLALGRLCRKIAKAEGHIHSNRYESALVVEPMRYIF